MILRVDSEAVLRTLRDNPQTRRYLGEDLLKPSRSISAIEHPRRDSNAGLLAPEASALSTELRGLVERFYHRRISIKRTDALAPPSARLDEPSQTNAAAAGRPQTDSPETAPDPRRQALA